MKRTTAMNIHRDPHPMRTRGTIMSMAEYDRFANAETRARHPQHYRPAKGCAV